MRRALAAAGPFLLFAVLAGLPAEALAQRVKARVDSTSGDDLLRRLQQEDDDYFGDDELFRFDETYRDSVLATVDTLGLEAFKDTVESRIPLLGYDLGPSTALLDYNRVEGLLVGAHLGVEVKKGFPLEFDFDAAYATGSERLRYRGTVMHHLVDTRRTDLWLHGSYSSTVQPYGMNDPVLNGLRAFAGGSDDRNYLWSRGGTAAVGVRRSGVGTAWLGYRGMHERSVAANTDFGVLSRMRDFNASIDDGLDQHAFLSLRLGSLGDRGWTVRLDHLISGGALGGDFAYNRTALAASARRYVFGRQELVAEVQAAQATGGAPVQALPDAGGIDLVRGWPVRSIVGERMAAGRLEWLIPYDALGAMGIPLRLQFVPWGDAARVWEGTTDEWITSAGLGVQYYVGPFDEIAYIRLDVAAPLGPDRPHDVLVLVHFSQRTF